MQWIVRVGVALLNIVWIFFFLQPQPFSVFVQRRSTDNSDEQMLFGEFCIEPQSHMKWTPTPHSFTIMFNKVTNTNTTYEANRESSLTLDDSHSINKTNIQPKDLHSSQSSELDYRTPAPDHEPHIIDLHETTSANPPVRLTLPGLTSSELISPSSSSSSSSSGGSGSGSSGGGGGGGGSSSSGSSSSSQAAHVTVEHHSEWLPKVDATGTDCCFKFYPRRVNKNLIRSYYTTDYRCPKPGVILVTKKARHICADPSLSWVESIMKQVDEDSF